MVCQASSFWRPARPDVSLMPEVTLSAGTIEYEDTGGSGPVIVLLHGVLMGTRH